MAKVLASSATVREDARFREAQKKLDEIKTQLDAIDAKVGAETARRNRVGGLGDHAEKAWQRVYDKPAPPGEFTAIDLGKLSEEQSILRDAVGIAVHRVKDVEAVISAEIIARSLPEYESILRRQYDAGRALAAVAEEERLFIQRLFEGGVTGLAPLVRVNWPSSTSDVVDTYKREFGYATGKTL